MPSHSTLPRHPMSCLCVTQYPTLPLFNSHTLSHLQGGRLGEGGIGRGKVSTPPLPIREKKRSRGPPQRRREERGTEGREEGHGSGRGPGPVGGADRPLPSTRRRQCFLALQNTHKHTHTHLLLSAAEQAEHAGVQCRERTPLTQAAVPPQVAAAS